MSIQAYRILKAPSHHEIAIGTIVYEQTSHDYGLARDDTEHTGIEHITVTLNSNGDYPGFTIPRRYLEPIKSEAS
jgi:hypothetical protein